MQTAQLTYAEMGYPVFPIVANTKRPLTANGFHDATTDTATIEQWTAAHLAATGPCVPITFWSLDVDGPDNEWFKGLGDKADGPGCRAVSLTPHGGRHFLFKAPDGFTGGTTQAR